MLECTAIKIHKYFIKIFFNTSKFDIEKFCIELMLAVIVDVFYYPKFEIVGIVFYELIWNLTLSFFNFEEVSNVVYRCYCAYVFHL